MDEFSGRPIHDRGNPPAPSACSRRDELSDNVTFDSGGDPIEDVSDRDKHKVGHAKRRCARKRKKRIRFIGRYRLKYMTERIRSQKRKPFLQDTRVTIFRFPIQRPETSWLHLAIFGQMTVGGLSGFEYVAIMAGECRSPSRTIARSVWDINSHHCGCLTLVGERLAIADDQHEGKACVGR